MITYYLIMVDLLSVSLPVVVLPTVSVETQRGPEERMPADIDNNHVGQNLIQTSRQVDA